MKYAIALVAAAATVLFAAQPASAASAIRISGITFDAGTTGHVDVTGGPVEVPLSFVVTDSDPAATYVSGVAEVRQLDGGPAWPLVFDEVPLSGGSATVRLDFAVPRYGAAATADWRVVRVTVNDGRNARRVAGESLASFGVTQLVDSEAPTLDMVALAPWQPAEIPGPATVDLTVTATDLQVGIWKGRLVMAGPDGARAVSTFAIAFDGRHLTCGHTLIDDVFDQVGCTAAVELTAGVWSVARITLTDQAGNTRVVNRPAGPAVTVTP